MVTQTSSCTTTQMAPFRSSIRKHPRRTPERLVWRRRSRTVASTAESGTRTSTDSNTTALTRHTRTRQGCQVPWDCRHHHNSRFPEEWSPWPAGSENPEWELHSRASRSTSNDILRITIFLSDDVGYTAIVGCTGVLLHFYGFLQEPLLFGGEVFFLLDIGCFLGLLYGFRSV